MHAFDRRTDRILIADRVCIACSVVKMERVEVKPQFRIFRVKMK